MSPSATRVRASAIAASIATVAAGLTARALLRGALAKYLGVALWASLVYFLALFVAPRARPSRLTLAALLISFAVEFAQLTPGPRYLASLHPAWHLVFGEYFSALDLPAYAAGVALAAAAHTLALARGRPGL